MSIAANLARVREQIHNAALQAGRQPEEITLVAVSKTFPATDIQAALDAGAHDIGENRVEEAAEKIPQLLSLEPSARVRWHLIGHLQRRKARDAATLFDLIQSVDSLRLAETLNRHAAARPQPLPILLQVNTGNDPNKFGFDPTAPDELFSATEKIIALPNLRLAGLMTIGPLVQTPDQARPAFRELRVLRDQLAARFPAADWRELSMGMTDDYAIAIAEGATIVRIGRAIFGQRT